MLVWLLKLLIVSLNIRSTHKAIARPTRSRDSSKKSNVASVPKRKRLKVQVTNWVVHVSYLILEQIADRVIGWIWFYSTVKAFVLVMLLVWRGAGSQILFDKLIKPTIKPWEGTFDFVGFVLGEVLEITIHCLLIVPRWIARKWRGRAAEPDVPSILRGLRQQVPAPRMAESMARSLERQQGTSDKINHKLSKPVTIRLNQVQASKPRRPPPPPSAPVTAPVTTKPLLAHPGLPPSLPPAAFSTAPFRPVTVPSSRATASTASTIPRPAASTSRLPIPAARQISTSMYPSLESLPPAPTYDPSQAPTKPSASSSRPPSFKPNQKRAPSPTLPESSTPPTRRGARSSHSIAQTAPSPSSQRSPTPPSRSPARQVIPPTPAPPGAFSFASSVPLSESPAIFAPPSTEQEMDVDEPEERPSPKSSLRKGKATVSKRSLGKVDTDESAAETPKKKKVKSSPIVARTSVTKRKGKGKEVIEETATVGESISTKALATPRQRALGAISQLATDLMDDEEGGAISLGSPKKKSRVGVLARSSTTGAGAKGKEIERTTATRSKRGQSKVSDEDEDDEEEAEVVPRKRKAGRRTIRQEEEDADLEVPTESQRTSRVNGGRSSANSSTSAVPSKPLARSRTSRSTAAPASAATGSRSTTRSRLSSRAASPATTLDSQATSTEIKATTAAPKRKARRVLLGRRAVDIEDEEEIEGVAVVARPRRKPGM
ncbi:hypothetical protein JCM5353_003078 [Sporobolomyces roseus]